jgi:hypothetical protein
LFFFVVVVLCFFSPFRGALSVLWGFAFFYGGLLEVGGPCSADGFVLLSVARFSVLARGCSSRSRRQFVCWWWCCSL